MTTVIVGRGTLKSPFFFHLVKLLMDNTQLVEWLQALELAQATITATIAPTGRLGPVGGLWPKLLAAAKESASLGLLRVVVVAAEQPEVAQELLAPDSFPLRVVKAATLQEAAQKLYEEHGPRQAVRQYEGQHCVSIELLGRSVPLAQHYQVLPLLRIVKQERLPRSLRSLKREEKSEPLRHGIDILRWEEELREERVTYERVSLEQVFNSFQVVAQGGETAAPRFVVLGPPGSGKTALVQYLGWKATNTALLSAARVPLPVRIRLREWELWTRQTRLSESALPHYLTERYRALTPAPSCAHWQRWLQRGEVLLLLDGLDEIEDGRFARVVLQTALATFTACPTVLTCRTVSFEQHRTVCPDFPLFTLAGLDQRQRNAFLRAFPAEHQEYYDPERLIAQLQSTPQLLPLAANPLLLSIICYVVDSTPGILLPATRGVLYEKALEKLLTQRSQRMAVRYPAEAPDTPGKLTILQRTAFYLFVAGNRKLTFTGQEVGQVLKQALREEGYGEAPALWANALRTDLLHNSGILRGDAEQGFFFFHLTVQEFLTAAVIAKRINEAGWETDLELSGKKVSVRQFVNRKAWDPQWQEVIVLLAGQLQNPLPLLTLLADGKKDDVFSHRLALAVQCLAEVRSRLNKEHVDLGDRITARAFSQWLAHETRSTTATVSHLTRALPALRQANGRMENVPLVEWLCHRLRDVNADVRSAVTEALGQIGEGIAGDSTALSGLVAALQDKDVLVRAKTVDAFRRVGAAAAQHPAVVPALVQAALHDEDWFVRFGATQALEQMEAAADEYSAASRVLFNSRHGGDPRETSPPLARLEPREVSTAPALETLSIVVAALHDQDAGVRAKAAEALSRPGEAILQHPQLLPTLIEVVLHDQDGGVRAHAARALGQMQAIAPQYPQLLLILTAALRDRDAGVRAQTAKALGQLTGGVGSRPEVLAALCEALRDKDSEVRFEAAEALAQIMTQGLRIFRRWWGRIEGKTVDELAAL